MLFQISEKIYVSNDFLILVKDSYSLTKFEWEICPKNQFLMWKMKLFQIKRFCVKKINNKPLLNLVLKVAKYHIYVQYTLWFFFENWITCPFLPKCRPPIVRRKVKKFSISIWFIVETFRLQKVGVAAGFWVHKVASDFDFRHFSKNLIY